MKPNKEYEKFKKIKQTKKNIGKKKKKRLKWKINNTRATTK